MLVYFCHRPTQKINFTWCHFIHQVDSASEQEEHCRLGWALHGHHRCVRLNSRMGHQAATVLGCWRFCREEYCTCFGPEMFAVWHYWSIYRASEIRGLIWKGTFIRKLFIIVLVTKSLITNVIKSTVQKLCFAFSEPTLPNVFSMHVIFSSV